MRAVPRRRRHRRAARARAGRLEEARRQGLRRLLRSALQGMPGTAMLPKAGFPELPADDVAEAVRYMLASVGLPPDLPAAARRRRRSPAAPRWWRGSTTPPSP